MYVAQAKGWFAADHIKFSVETFSGGDPTTMAAFANHETNMLEGGVSDGIEYLLNGVIPANGGKFIYQLAGNSYDIDTVKSITSLKGIEGHTVGISGPNDGDWIYFRAVMKAYGIPADSVTFVTAGSTAARLGALEVGSVDAIAEANTDRSVAATFGNIILPSQKSTVSIPTTSFFASTALLQHTKELQNFVAVLQRATTWTRANPVAATAICEHYTGASASNCSAGIQASISGAASGSYTWSATGAVQKSAVGQTITVEKDLFPQYHVKLTVNEIVDTQFTGTNP
jgi:ABC-type nitrate/sulfonate/bicarbonate transport system substrate-binding protein